MEQMKDKHRYSVGVVSPRLSPVVNQVMKGIVIKIHRLVSQVFISWRLMCLIRLESLSVEGQEPAIVNVIKKNN
jgi:hypothetical protein